MKQLFTILCFFVFTYQIIAQTNTFPTTGNVGIGTETPTQKLDVNGNLKVSGLTFSGEAGSNTWLRDNAGLQGNAGAVSGFFQTVNPVNYPKWASDWWHLLDVRHTNPTNNFAMQMAGSFFDQKFYVRKTNNNPSQPWSEIATMDSDGNMNFEKLVLKTNYYPEKNRMSLVFLGYSGITGARNWALRGVYQYLDGVNSNSIGGDLDLIKSMDGNTILGTKSDGSPLGNVGVGTTTPSQKLDVNGNLKVSGNALLGSAPPCCAGDAYTLAVSEETQINKRLPTIQFHTSGFNEAFFRLAADSRVFEIGDNQNVGVDFAIRNTTNTERKVWISGKGNSYFNGGNVGIGTTTPTQKLEINGNVKVSGLIYSGESGSNTWVRDNAGLQGNAGAASGFYQTASPQNFPKGASSWWHLLDVRHANPANNFAMQMAGSFFDQKFYVRKTNNNPSQPWRELVTTDTLGRLGVGTANPIYKQTIQTAESATPIIALNVNNPFGYGVGKGTSAVGIRFNRTPNDAGSTGVMADIWGGNENESSSTQGYLAFGTRLGSSESTIERMRIASSGNVGIGINNPSQKLEIRGKSGSPAPSGSTQNGIVAISSDDTYGTLHVGNNLASPYGMWLQSSGRDNLAINYPLILNQNGGNVGIGIATPSNTLTIDSKVVKKSGLTFANIVDKTVSYAQDKVFPLGVNLSGEVVLNETTAVPSLWTATGNNIVNANSGNVGIGGISSNYKLYLAGGNLNTTAGSKTYNLQLATYSGNNEYLNFTNERFKEGGSWLSSGFKLQQITDATPQGYIRWNGGNNYGLTLGVGGASETDLITLQGDTKTVGIGTKTPTALFHVGYTNGYSSILSESTETPFGLYTKTLSREANAETFRLGLKYNLDENNGFISFYRGGSTNGGFLGFSTSGQERIRINAEGNVGIGTASNKLTQTLNINGGIGFSNQNNGDKKLFSPVDGDLEWMTHNLAAGHGFAVSHQGTRAIYLNTSGHSYINGGNVGIGTANPATKLEVRGAVRIGNADVQAGGVVGGTGSFLRIGQLKESGNVSSVIDAFQNGGDSYSNLLLQSTNGSVAIGTIDVPTGYKLAVAGDVIAERIVVKLKSAWPDYVFNTGYPLKPLVDVESYLKEHKHLPDVPSEQEVKEKGVDVTQMNAVLLKKIEELTLYMIDLKKQNDELQKRVNAIEQK